MQLLLDLPQYQNVNWRWTYFTLIIWTFVQIVGLILVNFLGFRTCVCLLTKSLNADSPRDIYTGLAKTKGDQVHRP
jgi:hypothetical protein